MKPVGISALAFLGLILGLFLWLEFSADGTREYVLSETAERASEAAKRGDDNEQSAEPKAADRAHAEKRGTGGAGERDAKPSAPAPKNRTAGGRAATETALIEDGPDGPLPRIAVDGRLPWQVYATEIEDTDDLPRIAVVLTNMGLGGAVTETAIADLPAYVTFAFSPYGRDLRRWAARARGDGHEILITAPMEPVDYPTRDPGDKALLTELGPGENLARLKWIMSRFTGYVAVMAHMGSRFTGSAEAMRPVLRELKARGLAYVDNASAPRSAALIVADEIGLPRSVITMRIDTDLSAGAIDTQLAEAEQIARREGSAVILGYPYPVTVQRIAAWITDLEDRDIVVVPLSAMLRTKAKE